MTDLYKVKVRYRFSAQETSEDSKITEMLIPIHDIKNIRTTETEELIRSNIITIHSDTLDIKPEDICIDTLVTETIFYVSRNMDDKSIMTRTEYVEILSALFKKAGVIAEEFRLVCQNLPEANLMTEPEWEVYDKVHNAFLDINNEITNFQNQYLGRVRQIR